MRRGEDSSAAALAWIAAHSDIEQRLRDVPPSAWIRGLYFNNMLGVLRRVGRLPAYEEFF